MVHHSSMPKTRLGGAARLTLLFALEIGFVVLLHFLGSIDKFAVDFAHIKTWMDVTPPEIALVASIRILALVFSYWLLVTSFLYMAARAFHIPFLVRALELTTVPGVRRVIDAGLAAAIIGGTVFGGAGAVFAKSSNAQTNAHQAAVTSTYKDVRSLYNPTPAGDAPTVSVNLAPNQDPSGIITPSAADSNQKVVVASTETPAPATKSQTPLPTDNSTPQKDDGGNYLPTPAGGPAPSQSSTNTSDSTTTTSPSTSSTSKVTREPTPADSSTTTSSPKVTVPITSPPVNTSTTPSVDVGGKVIQRPNDVVTPQTNQSSSYTVVSGDNFWSIAENHVRNSIGREPTNTEVANYWVKLIDANKGNIRSGDPDLIFPGEVFTLPAL